MKLIDKEALLLALRKKRYSKQSLDLIESQPEVIAISLDQVKRFFPKTQFEQNYLFILHYLEEVENETR